MKTIRNHMIVVGISLMLFALGVAPTKAQEGNFAVTYLSGTFTLPFEAQWGAMRLPAGDYNLYYGHVFASSGYAVEIASKAKGGPHGMILTRGEAEASNSENVLVCVREGDTTYISELRMAAIGETARFAVPHGVQVESKMIASNQNKSGNAQLGQAQTTERVPVTLSQK